MAATDVYRNLTYGGWSIRRGGIVVARARCVLAYDVRWVVQSSGQQQARQTGQRNVHAFARAGTTIPLPHYPIVSPAWREVYYNPFKCDTFEIDGVPVEYSDVVVFGLRPYAQPVHYAHTINQHA